MRDHGPDGVTPLLEARGLGKRYGEGDSSVQALAGIDLALRPGKIYGLLGPNGAGKTTLLRVFATILAPTEGDVWLASRHTVHDAAAVRARLGYLSATTGIYGRLTPRELMEYFGRLHDMPRKRIRERAELLFATLGITSYQDRQTGKLSTGMRQKVSIARAFLHDPPVLILDEPTSGLDVVVRQSLLDLLRDLRSPQRLVILSTHDLAEAEELCDAYIFIHRGRIVAHGEREELLGDGSALRSVFFRELEDLAGTAHAL